MNRQVYALLVGIDDYPNPRHALRGCVNDVTAFADYLNGRITSESGAQLHLKMLTNQQATRQAVIDGFRAHLAQAQNGDVALFYYCGHGSQEQAPPEFWHLEPDRLNETIVCWDSRTEGNWDLADKELAKLIAEVDAKSPHIVVILDCCHSGSGTRGELLETAVRRLETDYRHRPFETYLASLEDLETFAASRSTTEANTDWLNLPTGRHIILSACLDCEEAKEYYGDGQPRGAFSYFLQQTLRQADGSLTYRDLFKRANALVRGNVATQSPQIEATQSSDLNQPFLGGTIAQCPAYFTVSYDKTHSWVIDGGAIHGIPPCAGEETTTFALFPFQASAEQLRNLSDSLGKAEVAETLPQVSKIRFVGMAEPVEQTTFKAVVTNLPLPPLSIRLEGEDEGVRLAREALQRATPDSNPSLYLREAEQDAPPRFRLLARNGEYVLTRPGDDRPLIAQIRGYSPNSAYMLAQQLEQIARWINISELSPPARGRIRPNAIEMQFFRTVELPYDPDNPPRGPIPTTEQPWPDVSELRLEYAYKDGKWKQPSFKLKLRNTSEEPLYCALLYLSEMYGSDASLLPGGGVWLQPGEETWALKREPIYASVPKELAKDGVTEVRDLLKLIVSTAEFDATLMEMPELGRPRSSSRGAATGGGRKSVLNRLMQRAQNRALSRQPEEDEANDDWFSAQVSIVTVRPLDTAPIPREGREIALGAGVTLLPHPELQAKAHLTSVPQAAREKNDLLLPPLLKQEPDLTHPLRFSVSRGSDPGLSVLELSDVSNYETVTPEQPLRLQVAAPLAENEQVIPVSYDGEFFLPLGRAKSENGLLRIDLERLPAPIAEGRRSVSGSVRIMFQKVLTGKLAIAFEYPLLAAASVNQDGAVEYEKDATKVAARVAQANRILLFIHSIFGDTHDMVAATQALHGRYDLILTFDYEDLQTPLEETAKMLKKRLQAVGLDAKHGKTLHVVAHGLGGLLARWYIEQEGGRESVQHLVMLGTPNGGSPWPTLKTWATSAIGLGLNGLSWFALPLKVFGQLLKVAHGIDTTFQQIQADSNLLQTLEQSPDPGVAYTILAGNTSIIPEALKTDANGTSSRIERLLASLTPKKASRSFASVAFLRQPNDMFASVHSMKNIPENRSPQPKIQEIACDHFAYFREKVGIQAISDALGGN